MKILCELYNLIKEMDELSCQECGKDLKTKSEFETGVCKKCVSSEECEGMYETYYTDSDGNLLTEAAVRMFKKVGKEIKRKYRCTTGPKKGKPVSDPSKCATRKDPKKVRQGRKSMRTKKGVRVRKSKITKRTATSKMVARLNAKLKGGTTSSKAKPAVIKTKKKTIKQVLPKSSTTTKPVKATKPKKAKKTK